MVLLCSTWFFFFRRKKITEMRQATWMAEWGEEKKSQTLFALQFAVESIQYWMITINGQLCIAIVISDGFDPPWKVQPSKSLSQRETHLVGERGSRRRLNQRAEPRWSQPLADGDISIFARHLGGESDGVKWDAVWKRAASNRTVNKGEFRYFVPGTDDSQLKAAEESI